MAADYFDFRNRVEVQGTVKADQATQPGECVVLGSDSKVPVSVLPDQQVDLSGYYTKAQTDNLLDGKVDDSQLGDYYTSDQVDGLLDGYVKTSQVTNMARVWRGTVSGDGSSKTLMATHNLGAIPAVTVYKGGELYITDTNVTSTQVQLTFYEAPASGTSFTVVCIG